MSDLELEEQNKAERKTELIAIAADLGPNQLMRCADSIVLLIRPELPNNGHYHALKGIAGGRGTGLVGEARPVTACAERVNRAWESRESRADRPAYGARHRTALA
jgi:hypothetical protein